MNKRKIFAALILALAVMLSACGSKRFQCAICMREVNEVPHAVTVWGQDVEICDSCYGYLK